MGSVVVSVVVSVVSVGSREEIRSSRRTGRTGSRREENSSNNRSPARSYNNLKRSNFEKKKLIFARFCSCKNERIRKTILSQTNLSF